MKYRIVDAIEFEERCLTFLGEVERQGLAITIARDGRPVAILSPVKRRRFKSPANSWAGRMQIVGDIVNSDPNVWDVVSNPENGL
jgi:antitoxin (DNA-binding transcriptional repressor) of toxin-antitoxin stability system